MPQPDSLHDGGRMNVISRMLASRPVGTGFRISVALCITVLCAAAWVRHVHAQAPAQIGASSPLPVFVTNPASAQMLPEGFVAGSRWRFTTWTTPSVLTWTATVNKTTGPWANLTITGEDRSTNTRWYYVPAMPGSWERQ